jgi:hypothetical protein
LILVTNAVALLGVAYNRSDTDSVLNLTLKTQLATENTESTE